MKLLRPCTIALLLVLLFVSPALSTETSQTDQSEPFAVEQLDLMPLAFTENHGQWNEQVQFKASSGGAAMWFTSDGIYYQFTRRTPVGQEPCAPDDPRGRQTPSQVLSLEGSAPSDSIEQLTIKASIVGANPNPQIVGDNVMEYKCNYFLGNDPNKWRTSVPNYRAIVLEEIYPSIDLRYYSNEYGRLEYDFIVEPGADPSMIQVQYDGSKSLSINNAGELVIETEWHSFTQLRPVIYQDDNGTRKPIDGQYVLLPGNTFCFAIGEEYDPTLALVIDPVLIFSTYLGGSGDDQGYSIKVDQDGYVIVTGQTNSSDFPMLLPYDGTCDGYDAFVTKFNTDGTSLVFSTYFGGSNEDVPYDMCLDSDGNIYIAGTTYSSDFPTYNAYDATMDGSGDAFVSKISSAGDVLEYSTYIGGSELDKIFGICTDGSGNAYVTGYTYSADFPTVNPYDAGLSGNDDAIVAKLSSTGSSLVYSTFLGGSSTESGNAIEVDDGGFAYVVGSTRSSNFPTENPYQSTYQGGSHDVFVTKFYPAGNSLVYSTFLGGSDVESGYGIEVDASGSAYVAGFTKSADYPTQDAYDDSYGGDYDIAVSVLSPAGNILTYSTYLGSTGRDRANDIALGEDGSIHITGNTTSSDFPVVNAYDPDYNGGYGGDAYVSALSAVGNELVYSTFLGGTGEGGEGGGSIDMDTEGHVYVTGSTTSFDFPTENAYDDSHNGGTPGWEMDAFVTCMRWYDPVAVISVFPNQNGSDVSRNTDITIEFTASMNPDSFDIENDGISVYGSITGWHSFDFSYDDPTKTVTLDPYGPFEPGELVTVCIKKNAQSAEGLNLTYDYVWQFYVETLDGSRCFSAHFLDSLWVGATSVCIADFDRDNKLDFAVTSDMDPNINVYRNISSDYLLFYIYSAPASITAPRHVIAVQNDLYHDMYAITYDDNELGEYPNDGTGHFGDSYRTLQSTGVQIAHYPVKGTGDFTFAVSNYDQNMICLYTLDSILGFTWETSVGAGSSPHGIVWADVDSDGRLDLISANSGSDNITIRWSAGFRGKDYRADKTDFFVGPASGPWDLVAADFNGDGLCDIATANWGSQSLGILINDDGRSFHDVNTLSLNSPYPNCVLVLDINADGYLDLLVSNDLDPWISVAMGNGDGTFTFTSPIFAWTIPFDMAAGDFNNDGAVDLVLASYVDENVVVLYNIKYDEDADGIPTVYDNCPEVYNPEQEDVDQDDIGDVCDSCTDTDNDDYGNPNYPENTCPLDNCPTIYNNAQIDSDGDGVGDACTFEEMTSTGTNVQVDLGGYVTVEFSEVTGDGDTELEVTSTGPDPSGLTLVPSEPPVYYEISTTATYTGDILICIPYDDTDMTLDDEQALSMRHYINDAWVNITYSIDTDANIICGLTSSLSPFVLAISEICGDADGSEAVDIDDVVYLIQYIFAGGPAPYPLASGDADCSGGIDIDDVVYLINYIFASGPAPCDPDGDGIPDC